MPVINNDNKVFTVLVRFLAPATEQDRVAGLCRDMIPVFRRQPGFVSMALHRSLDGTQVVSYLQWESRADHEACQASEEVLAAGADLMRDVRSGALSIEVTPCELVEAVSASGD